MFAYWQKKKNLSEDAIPSQVTPGKAFLLGNTLIKQRLRQDDPANSIS